MSHLELNNFKYGFLLMMNYLEHRTLSSVIKKHQDNLIMPVSIYEYCRSNLLLAEDNLHPNINGHQGIANIVDNFIRGKYGNS